MVVFESGVLTSIVELRDGVAVGAASLLSNELGLMNFLIAIVN